MSVDFSVDLLVFGNSPFWIWINMYPLSSKWFRQHLACDGIKIFLFTYTSIRLSLDKMWSSCSLSLSRQMKQTRLLQPPLTMFNLTRFGFSSSSLTFSCRMALQGKQTLAASLYINGGKLFLFLRATAWSMRSSPFKGATACRRWFLSQT